MKMTFLGTAAATSYPLAFCRCEFCRRARRLGGKDHRKRSALVINDDLLIDLGPDALAASFLYRKPFGRIRYCLQTHPHSDHFDASHLATRAPEYAGVDVPPLQIAGSPATLQAMSQRVAGEGCGSGLFDPDELRRMNLQILPVEPFRAFEMGAYRVVSFPANHDAAVDSRLYAICEDGFSMFYGTDTDVLPEVTWQGLREKRIRFDVVILDHTYGPGADGGGHLNAHRFIEQVRRMREENLLSENARILATHISHEGNPPHAELSEYAAKRGYEIAYDGLTV